LGQHPHVVQAFGALEIEERPCLLLEYVAGDVQHGSDLSTWIGSPDLNVRQSLTFAWQLCDGMCYATDKFHEAGKEFVHRDLKPNNLLVVSPEQLKITDFGISLIYDVAQTGAPSDDKGNLVYWSPEQCRGDETLDARADVYAFGCVLYEMLLGETIFGLSRESKEFIEAHQHRIPRSPKSLNPDFSSALDDLVMQCLEKEPANRYPDFAKLRDTIGNIYENLFGVHLPKLQPPRFKIVEGGEQMIGAFTDHFLENAPKVLKNLEGVVLAELGNENEIILYAEALARAGRVEEAVRFLEEKLDRLPMSGVLWNERARLLMDLGRGPEALACFEQSLVFSPLDPVLLNNIGFALIALDRPQEALTRLESCVTLNPRFAAAWNNKGRAHAALGQWEKASQCYKKSVESNPAEAEVWYNWSVAAGELDQTDRAKSYLKKCLNIDPKHQKALHNKSIYDAIGNS
jgi:tetratricopeptide (TPR) repeat protein